jgi:curved DNA-binding protein CbpA
LSKDDLAKIPNFANDFELAAFLQEKRFLTKTDCDRLFSEQIEGIIVDILSWPSGDWTFSSLARLRDGLEFKIDTTRLLVDFGRCMPVDTMLGRFRSLDESFRRSAVQEIGIGLRQDEAFVLSRANDGVLTAADLVNVAAMQETDALHAIYTLWLGGLLLRTDWQPAFSNEAINTMRTAKLELKTEARLPGVPAPAIDEKPTEVTAEPAIKEPELEISLDDYLSRVENAETHYDILGVDVRADIAELKRAYFGLARMFHPDRYHAEGGETLRRIQHAFTELAQAHETLKNPETREVYDYRMRKELTDREKRSAAGNIGDRNLQIEQAAEHFERGFSLLMDGDHETALPFLARAVHYAPKNARYHAYYGKGLSSDPGQRHKAETEMQTALKLDPGNATFRILLAEFFIQVNLKKRAEGELNRLLAMFPSNREARDLLDSLK